MLPRNLFLSFCSTIEVVFENLLNTLDYNACNSNKVFPCNKVSAILSESLGPLIMEFNLQRMPRLTIIILLRSKLFQIYLFISILSLGNSRNNKIQIFLYLLVALSILPGLLFHFPLSSILNIIIIRN